MEKFAVETIKNDNNIKTANKGCPVCGGELKDTNQYICNKCGSKPFELGDCTREKSN
jgi:ribosomal protein S27AE